MLKAIYFLLDKLPDRNDFKNFIREVLFSGKITGRLTFITALITIIKPLLSIIKKETGNYSKIINDILQIGLYVFIVILILAFINKWNETRNKNILLEEIFEYYSILIQDNIIHLSHITKSFEQYDLLSEQLQYQDGRDFYKAINSLREIDVFKNKSELPTELDRISKEASFIDVNSAIINQRLVKIFDKIFCKGLKRFFKDCLMKNKEALKKITNCSIPIKIYLYESDKNTNYIYEAFIDDDLYFSEGGPDKTSRIAVSNSVFYGSTNAATKEELNLNANNSLIFNIPSNNISNTEKINLGYIMYDFTEYVNTKKSFKDDLALKRLLKNIAIAITETMSYNMKVMRKNMENIRIQGHFISDDTEKDNNEINFLEIIKDNF